jgi:UDP-GlcNAc:undecaprenyl-phosphate GlcNAc-1-phosphate transferase
MTFMGSFLPDEVVLVLASALAFGLCRLILPAVIRLANSRGWLDQPGDRRVHITPVPRLGGVAVVASVAIVVFLMPGDPFVGKWGLVIGALTVFAIGLADDLWGVSPRAKLVVQAIAAIVVMSDGFSPHTIAIANGAAAWELGGLAGSLLAFLWIVGVTNAFNLIDGIDGLAGTMTMIALGACLGSGIIAGNDSGMVLLAAIAGAVAAFLRSNWSPARVFLGDAGSMTLGFVLAVLTVVKATDASGVTFPLVPLTALAYPLLDTFTSMARRWVRGHPFSRADGRHIHHQLRALGFETARAVQLLTLTFVPVAVFGLAIVYAPPRLTVALALAGMVAVFGVVVSGVRWLGYNEFIEAGASVASVVRHARQVVNEKLSANEVAERILEARTLDEVRDQLRLLVEHTRVLDIELVPVEESSRRSVGPCRLTNSIGGFAMRLDYPLVPTGIRSPDLVLRIWSVRPDRTHHPAAERLASRLGPVLEEWLANGRHPGPNLDSPYPADTPSVSRTIAAS